MRPSELTSTTASSSQDTHLLCIHCGLTASEPFVWNEKAFCCTGCMHVYRLLHEQGLTDFYKLRDQVRDEGVCALPAVSQLRDFSYVDSPDFQKQYVYGQGTQALDVYVEGVHCAACLWLLEKLPDHVPGLLKSRLNLGTQVLTVVGDPGSLAKSLDQIQKWGYIPHPLKNSLDRQRLEKKDFYKDLSRLGVAAFASSNIMLISVCIYAGVAGNLKNYFEMISFVLCLPVLMYSAVPLYLNSWQALRQKKISIDLPIVLAVLVAFTVSLHGLFYGGKTYFDSISALVFLILSSRFILKRTLNKHMSTSRFQMFFDISGVKKWNGQVYENIPAESILAGDLLLVEQNSVVPVDAEVLSGSGYLNQSLLTGESSPVEIKIPQNVMMGAKLISGKLQIKALVDFKESRLQKLLRQIEASEEPVRTLKIADKVGQLFLTSVMLISAGIVAYWWLIDPREGVYRALSFMIVACPCTFASVIPLVFSLALKKAGRQGIFIKDPSLFERISKIKKVYFDKTGTLTLGQFEVLQFDGMQNVGDEIFQKIYMATSQSEHPVSRAIAQYLVRKKRILYVGQPPQITEISGRGLEARWPDGSLLSIEKNTLAAMPTVAVPNMVQIVLDKKVIARVVLGDVLRSSGQQVVREMSKIGYDCWMLSGDQESAVKRVAMGVGISPQQALANLTLEDKAQILLQNPNSMMVGDGNNDALAFKNSSIGVAVLGGVESALRSSHVYMAQHDFKKIIEFIKIARTAHTLIFISLLISVTYNILAGTLAVLGYIHPLLAAFIMPVNAMTVFMVCLWFFRERQSQWN